MCVVSSSRTDRNVSLRRFSGHQRKRRARTNCCADNVFNVRFFVCESEFDAVRAPFFRFRTTLIYYPYNIENLCIAEPLRLVK